jgi:hypothetical protein
MRPLLNRIKIFPLPYLNLPHPILLYPEKSQSDNEHCSIHTVQIKRPEITALYKEVIDKMYLSARRQSK